MVIIVFAFALLGIVHLTPKNGQKQVLHVVCMGISQSLFF